MNYIIHIVFAAVRDDGSWDLAAFTTAPTNYEDAKKTVYLNRQRSNVLACAMVKVNTKEESK